MTKKVLLFIILIITIYITGCGADIDPRIANTPFGLKALNYEFIITLIAVLGGYACIVAGFILTIMGFTGSIEWIIETTTFTSRITNAGPGIILMIIGTYIVAKRKLNIKANIVIIDANELKESETENSKSSKKNNQL